MMKIIEQSENREVDDSQQEKVSPFINMQGGAVDKGVNGTTAVLIMLLGLAGIGSDMAFPNRSEDETARFEFFSIASSYLVILSQAQLFDCFTRSALVQNRKVLSSNDEGQLRKARFFQVISGVLAFVYATVLACSNYCHSPDDFTYGELTVGSCHGEFSVASSNITAVLSFYVFLNFARNLFEIYQPYFLLPSFHEKSYLSTAYTLYGMIIHPTAAIIFTNAYPEPDFAEFAVASVTNEEDSQATVNNYLRQMTTLFFLFNATDQINSASDGICNAIRKNIDSDALAIFSLFFVKLVVFAMGTALLDLSVKAHEYRANKLSGDVGEPFGATAPSTLGIFGIIIMANALSKIVYSAHYYSKEFEWNIFERKSKNQLRTVSATKPDGDIELAGNKNGTFKQLPNSGDKKNTHEYEQVVTDKPFSF